MAEKILNTRILMKVDTLENWNSSTLPLKKGELAFATVAASAGTGLTEPVVMVKIGEDGVKTFKDLQWNFYAKASDVLAACKSEDALKAFVNGVIADAGIASSDAMEALAGRVTTAEGKITALEGTVGNAEGGLVKGVADNAAAIAALQGLVGDTKVATQIANAITALDLANTYEAKGEAAKVQTALDTYKTSNDAAVQKNATDIAGEIARAKAAEEANANAITAIKDGTTIDSFKDVEEALAGKEASGAAAQALADAKTYADGKDSAMNTRVEALEAIDHSHTFVESELNKIADGDVAKWNAAEQNAKDYTDGKIEDMVGTETVSAQISTAITNLDLANTYDAKGAAASAESAAKGHADSLNTAMNTRVEALEAIDHDHANKGVLDGITAEKVAAWDAAEANAIAHADGLDDAMDERVAALEAKFTGEDSVADQIADAVADETALREAADADLAADIKAISDDYLKVADKTALQDQITANDGDIAALQGLVGDTAVATQITNVTDPLAARVQAVEDDYLKAADKTELQGNIDTVSAAVERLTNGVSAEEVDGVNDLIAYVNEHGAEVTGMKADIKANADAIDALAPVASTGSWNDLVDRPFGEETSREVILTEREIPYPTYNITLDGNRASLDAGTYIVSLRSSLEYVNGVAPKEYTVVIPKDKTKTLNVENDDFSHVLDMHYELTETHKWHVSTYADDGRYLAIYKLSTNITYIDDKYISENIARVSDQSAIDARVTTAEGEIDVLQADLNAAETGLKARMTAAEADIDALQTKVGDETVAAQIEAAIEALKIGDYAKAADLTAAVARIAQNETDIAALEGRMDTAEGDIDALETEVAKKANDADLAAIAKTGNVNDLIQTEGDVLVFDCGTSAV